MALSRRSALVADAETGCTMSLTPLSCLIEEASK